MLRCRLPAILLLPFLLLGYIGVCGWFTAAEHITGQVFDDAGPVEAARVFVQGSRRVAHTNGAGVFRLLRDSAAGNRPVLAAKADHIIAAGRWQNDLRLQLRKPAEANDISCWIDPAPNPQQPNNCGNCHRTMYQEWNSSAHARSADNRRFLGLVGGVDWHGKPSSLWSVRDEHPLGLGVCASCHVPSLRDPTLEYDPRSARGVDARGVHCDYCHKVADAVADEHGLRFGRDGLLLGRSRSGRQLFFGPLDDAVRRGEEFVYAPFYKQSRYCASCHEGVIFGVHVYGTYSEWLQSPARARGQQCQSCHMAATGKLTNIAPGKGGLERDPSTLASHALPGANVGMLQQCLHVDTAVQRREDNVLVDVALTAHNVGHRVPTGFIDRQLLLIVEAFDKAGRSVPLREGPQLPSSAGEKLDGTAGKLFAKQLTGENGQTPSPFWLPHTKLSDTRLTPERPDRSAYRFGSGATAVRVRIVYRRFWQAVAVAKHWPDEDIVVMAKTVRISANGIAKK